MDESANQGRLRNAMQPEIIEVTPTGQLVRDVIALGNGPAKRTLGFLPDEGFLDRARRGTLLGAVLKGRLLGYLLYDLPSHDVKIVHLCVDAEARRQGVARLLVEEIAARHPGRQRIMLSCRYDYPANGVWRALDFRPQSSRPGRSHAGHFLTIWVKDFGHPTLFDDLADDRPTAALDHNVFLDLHLNPTERPQGQESRHLLDSWIGECVELCITDEVFHEIHRHTDQRERATEQRWASNYRNISRPDDDWSGLVGKISALIPAAGKSDHRQVARAAAAGASYLISRDRALLSAADSIEAAVDLRILPPEGLIVRLDQMRSDSQYRPAALQGTELSQVSPTDDLQEQVFASLLNNAAGERRATLGGRLRPMLADPVHHDVQVVQTPSGLIVAGFARTIVQHALEVPFVRVAPGTVGANVVARQLLFAQRKRAADLNLRSVRVTDPNLSKDVREALKLEHFEANEHGWACEIKAGLINAEDLGPASSVPRMASDFEDKFWPAKVVGAGIRTYVVPIKAAFAEALFDSGLAEQSLLPRQLGLGLSREHVYYRRTQNARGISAGARILWYVTGDAPVHSRGSIRAISQVADVVVGRPRTLHARFERFGVYSAEQVSRLADGNGQVMAIQFVNTEVLAQPVPLDDLETLWAEQASQFFPPQSPTLIDEHMFCLLYKRSSGYAA